MIDIITDDEDRDLCCVDWQRHQYAHGEVLRAPTAKGGFWQPNVTIGKRMGLRVTDRLYIAHRDANILDCRRCNLYLRPREVPPPSPAKNIVAKAVEESRVHARDSLPVNLQVQLPSIRYSTADIIRKQRQLQRSNNE